MEKLTRIHGKERRGVLPVEPSPLANGGYGTTIFARIAARGTSRTRRGRSELEEMVIRGLAGDAEPRSRRGNVSMGIATAIAGALPRDHSINEVRRNGPPNEECGDGAGRAASLAAGPANGLRARADPQGRLLRDHRDMPPSRKRGADREDRLRSATRSECNEDGLRPRFSTRRSSKGRSDTGVFLQIMARRCGASDSGKALGGSTRDRRQAAGDLRARGPGGRVISRTCTTVAEPTRCGASGGAVGATR